MGRNVHPYLVGIVDEIKSVVEREKIQCELVKGGYMNVAARYPEQEATMRAWFAQLRYDGGHRGGS